MTQAASSSRPYEGREPSFPDGSTYTMLAAGHGDGETGSGLFSCSDRGVRRLDDLATAGICLNDDATTLYRSLHAPHGPNAPAEVLRYAPSGLSHRRIDGVQDPHGLAVDGSGCLLAVSTFTNEVVWINDRFEIVNSIRFPGEFDSMHLNNLYVEGPSAFASAFRVGGQFRGWVEDLTKASGVIFELATFNVVAEGLVTPHNPTRFEDAWLVCESGPQRLIVTDPGVPTRARLSIQLEGWTRGLVVTPEWIFVGESANRLGDRSDRATVAIIDRASMRVVGRWRLPCAEIFDLVLAPLAICDLVEASSDELHNKEVSGRLKRWWRVPAMTSTSGSWEGDRAEIEPEFPSVVDADSLTVIAARIRNVGSVAFDHLGDAPVSISYRWRRERNGAILPGAPELRTKLIESLAPGEETALSALVRAPSNPGEYFLSITLVREGRHWFDQVSPADIPSASVYVRSPQVQPE